MIHVNNRPHEFVAFVATSTAWHIALHSVSSTLWACQCLSMRFISPLLLAYICRSCCWVLWPQVSACTPTPPPQQHARLACEQARLMMMSKRRAPHALQQKNMVGRCNCNVLDMLPLLHTTTPMRMVLDGMGWKSTAHLARVCNPY